MRVAVHAGASVKVCDLVYVDAWMLAWMKMVGDA